MHPAPKYHFIPVATFVAAIIFFISPVFSFSQALHKVDSINNKARHQKDTSTGYLYSKLNSLQHTKSSLPLLPDTDGDGITDQFDLEPNTPAGAEVDSHGRAADTDGDGVPDYRDKEKLTQLSCFPADSNGVGVCPEPWCCRIDFMPVQHLPGYSQCALDKLPGIKFKPSSATLSRQAIAILDSVSQQMLANPHCRVRVTGYESYYRNYHIQQLCWDRVFSIIKYLVDVKGILSTHLIFSYGEESADPAVVDLKPTTDDGPHILPAPHPIYSTLSSHTGDW